jgi:hypothetical protein
MIKSKLRDMPVITIHIEDSDKKSLTEVAKNKGTQLATYCRMVLLESLKESK